jgi:hypothetical protein
MLRASTGAVWACIFDHIVFAYLIDMIHVQHTDMNMNVTLDNSYYARIIAYQVIAFLLVFVYYVYKNNKIKEAHRVMQMELDS